MLQSAIVCATVALSSAFIDTASAVRTTVRGATENASTTAKAARNTPYKNFFIKVFFIIFICWHPPLFPSIYCLCERLL